VLAQTLSECDSRRPEFEEGTIGLLEDSMRDIHHEASEDFHAFRNLQVAVVSLLRTENNAPVVDVHYESLQRFVVSRKERLWLRFERLRAAINDLAADYEPPSTSPTVSVLSSDDADMPIETELDVGPAPAETPASLAVKATPQDCLERRPAELQDRPLDWAWIWDIIKKIFHHFVLTVNFASACFFLLAMFIIRFSDSTAGWLYHQSIDPSCFEQCHVRRI